MTEAMTVAAPSALAPSSNLSREQLDLLKRTLCKGASDDEFRMFLEVCQRRRIDPFSKMLYLVPRWDSKLGREVMAVQSSIDYFRLTAGRSDKYAGQVGPQWCGENGDWKDVWLAKEMPRAARVGVMCKDFKEPLWAVALWDSYVQKTKDGKPAKFWATMGSLMLGKCAEALAIRRAFPEDLAGLYTPEEMAQDVREVEHVEVDRRTGEVTSAAPAKLPERTQAPRTVDVQATKAEPASLPPAASQEPQTIDWSAVPTYRKDGAMVCWGVPVEEKVHKNFNNWKRYLAVEDVRSKSCLKNKSWDQVVHGGGADNTPPPTIDGKRVQALQFVVGKALTEDAALGKLSIQWRQRAVWCLWLIYEEHRNREEDAARNADFKEQTGIEIDPNGSSADAVPF